jgi:hypothetical protein
MKRKMKMRLERSTGVPYITKRKNLSNERELTVVETGCCGNGLILGPNSAMGQQDR